MKEKHLKILEFLIEQPTNISYKDFPLQLQELSPDCDPLMEGGLLMELEILKKSKQWVINSRTFLHDYTITELGTKALREAKSETFEQAVQSQKIRKRPLIKQPVIIITIGLFVLVVMLITHYFFQIS